jgi:hypothetical protein
MRGRTQVVKACHSSGAIHLNSNHSTARIDRVGPRRNLHAAFFAQPHERCKYLLDSHAIL